MLAHQTFGDLAAGDHARGPGRALKKAGKQHFDFPQNGGIGGAERHGAGHQRFGWRALGEDDFVAIEDQVEIGRRVEIAPQIDPGQAQQLPRRDQHLRRSGEPFCHAGADQHAMLRRHGDVGPRQVRSERPSPDAYGPQVLGDAAWFARDPADRLRPTVPRGDQITGLQILHQGRSAGCLYPDAGREAGYEGRRLPVSPEPEGAVCRDARDLNRANGAGFQRTLRRSLGGVGCKKGIAVDVLEDRQILVRNRRSIDVVDGHQHARGAVEDVVDPTVDTKILRRGIVLIVGIRRPTREAARAGRKRHDMVDERITGAAEGQPNQVGGVFRDIVAFDGVHIGNVAEEYDVKCCRHRPRH